MTPRFSKSSLTAELTQMKAHVFTPGGFGMSPECAASLNEGKVNCLRDLIDFVASCPRFSKAVWREHLSRQCETLLERWAFDEGNGAAQVMTSSDERRQAYVAFDTCRWLWNDLDR